MNNVLHNKVVGKYKQLFSDSPDLLILAPGRINLIGEHTDYSNGYVLPVAIDLRVALAIKPRKDRQVRVYSIKYDQEISFHLSNILKGTRGWQEYIKGIAWTLQENGLITNGWDGVVSGNIPVGAGLSSSAAFEILLINAFCYASDLKLSVKEMAKISQFAEIHWVGVNVGIMDQLISAAGGEGHALLLDCKTLEYSPIPIPENITMVVLDTRTRRELSHSDYNTRHKEVKDAARLLGVSSLRDVNLPQLHAQKEKLNQVLFNRARHVVNENQRVLKFTIAMRNNDVNFMGQLINESHTSLRDDYQVSSSELNSIVELAQKHPRCLGARMTGAGFGGCAVALLDGYETEDFINSVLNAYHTKTGIEARIFVVRSADGVRTTILE